MRRLLPLLTLALALLTHAAGAAERTVYFVPNAQGSPIAAMDEQGQVLWREAYAPWGERLQRHPENTARPAYTGKPEDPETGLVYMGSRLYDPEAAQFTGMDPQGFNEQNPQSWGRYLYANNSPYVFNDPDGEVPVMVIFLFVGKEGLGVAFESATGLPAVFSVKGLAKAVGEAGPALKAAAKNGPIHPIARQTTILGESMKDRVEPYAERVGARTIPFSTTPDKWAQLSYKEKYKLNDGEIRKRIGEGDRFSYIGQDMSRPDEMRRKFDLTGSELLRLNDRGVGYDKVPTDMVKAIIGRN